MTTQLLTAIIISFAIGASLAWIIFKYRVAITMAELKNKHLASEEKLSEANQKLQKGTQEMISLQETNLRLDKENTRLNTELSAVQNSFEKLDGDWKESIAKCEKIQNDLTDALQKKASTERDLVNANRNISDLLENEKTYKSEIEAQKDQVSTIKEENAKLVAKSEETDRRLKEQQEFIEAANVKLREAFATLSAEALTSNNTSFVTLAKETLEAKLKEAQGNLEKKEEAIKGLVKPLDESLKTMDTKINELEKSRVGAYRDIFNHLEQVKLTTEGLKKETNNLVGALKTSHSRGRYGEIALRRLVEFAGMIDHCHFDEQITVEDESGRLRPDMIIKLPENKKLVVDSKVPLSSYLKIFETEDVDQQQLLVHSHTTAVKDHLKKLSAKAYWSQFDEAPDFVIMYMHIESSFGTAIQTNPNLIEEAFKNRIIIATPTILISILMSVGYSWNQIKTMENIEEIRSAAVELYERSTVFVNYLVSMGNNLQSTVDYYNKAVGSFDGMFMPQARKINNLSQAYTKKILKELEPIELTTRKVSTLLPQSEAKPEDPERVD